jgi:hypothetical protein
MLYAPSAKVFPIARYVAWFQGFHGLGFFCHHCRGELSQSWSNCYQIQLFLLGRRSGVEGFPAAELFAEDIQLRY